MVNTANIKDAVYLIDDESIMKWGSLRSVWDFFNDGEGPKRATGHGMGAFWLINSDHDGETFLRRDCNKFEGGVMTLEMLCRNLYGNGAYIALGSRDDAFLKLTVKDGKLYAGDAEISDFAYDADHFIKLEMDMTTSKFKAYIDARYKGEFDFTKPAFTYSCFRIGFEENDTGAIGLYFTRLFVNYLVNDNCLNRYIGKLPDEYSVKCTRGASVKSVKRVSDDRPEYTYQSKNKVGSISVTKRAFAKSKGNVVLEAMYLLDKAEGKVKISLNKGANEVVSVYDEGEELYCYCGCTHRKHHKNVWQTLRIYADTDKQTADLWLNGKKMGTVDFECTAKFIDNFKIEYEATADSSMMFSNIKVWVKPEEPEDYVPMPVIPKKKGDYAVGMNICSLWREGTHVDWDAISPYDDVKPVLGFYEEGHPETADWEIKFLAEHGIDYELYCWYSSESHEPIKTTPHNHAWVNGHFYAKYSHMEKFALLWEAASCLHPRGIEDFKANLVPYWLDYFFSDDRYMTVDNKAVMSCFGVGCVVQDLGGAENVKIAFEYLRNEVKKLGYDDLIIMGCHDDPVRLKECGYDAFHAYHWGGSGYQLEVNKKCIKDNIAKNGVHIVPTISVGFKNVGWGGTRRPNLSVQDMYAGVKFCMDEILPTYEKNSWKSKMLHLSTWNEYGEGTYMMPTGLNGFGYLDAVRKAVCVDEPHEDVVPTEEQKLRIGYLRPQNRHILARTKYDIRPLPAEEKIFKQFTFKTEADIKKWKFDGITDIRIEDGCLCGKATKNYPTMQLKNYSFDSNDVAFARIRMTNTYATTNKVCMFRMRVSNTEDKVVNPSYEFAHHLYVPEPLETIEFQLDIHGFFTNTITAIQLIPTPLAEGTFKIESITLYSSVPHKSIYGKNGRQLFLGDYPLEMGGEMYIPLDPASGILGTIGYPRYEWLKAERTLKLWNKESKVEIVLDRAYLTKDGENYTLVRPAFMKDGIPAIALSDIEKIFGVKTEKEGNKIYIK